MEDKLVYAGDLITLKCGVEVKVLAYHNDKNVVVADSEGRTQTANLKQLKTGCLKWGAPPRKIVPKKVKVGDVFTLNCGVDVTVKEYINSGAVLVHAPDGSEKWTNSSSLKLGSVKIGEYWRGQFRRKLEEELGSTFMLKAGIPAKILEYKDACNILIGDDYGNSKWTSSWSIKEGTVCWAKFGYPSTSFALVGEVHESEKYGEYEVISQDIKNRRVGVRWLVTGNVQDDCDMYEARLGRIADRQAYADGHWDFLGVTPGRYYVYIAKYNDEVLYIGKGKGGRYLHVSNGGSHVVALNRMFFEDKKVVTEIFKDDLDEVEALSIEKALIKSLKPLHNKAHTANNDSVVISVNAPTEDCFLETI